MMPLASSQNKDSRFKIQDSRLKTRTQYRLLYSIVLLIIGLRETATKTYIGRCRSSQPIYFQTGIGVLMWYVEN